MKYKLYRKIDNEWYYWGKFTDINKLVKAVYEMSKFYPADDIKVEVETYET